jgi:hypothetical protein
MSTESKIYWGIGLASISLLFATFFIPGDRPEIEDLPWHIEHPTPDSLRVFGLTLGVSTPTDAERHFREAAKPSLFRSPEGQLVAEMFFERVELAGLLSKMVVTVTVPDAELQAMYERGLRMSAIVNGKKITPTPEDGTRLTSLPISSLTYMPALRLDDALFLKRFGRPVQIVKETKSGNIHWLYPQNGLDIALGGGEKPLLQYVPPKEFDKLLRPLLANGQIIAP